MLQQRDELKMAEQLPIQAITQLALTKALTTQSVNQQEVLLAYLLGYSAHARQVALNLTADNAVRRYVHHKSDALKSIAEQTGANNQTKYLYLLWLARQRDYEGWKDWLKHHFTKPETLPLFKTAVILNQFGINKQIATILPYATVTSLAHKISEQRQAIDMITQLGENIDKLENIVTDLLSQFRVSTVVAILEVQIQLLKPQYAGPFLDGETYAAYFRGYFYSGLYRLGLHYLDSLSSESATTEYAKFLGDSKQPIAAEFQRWYRNMADSKAGKGNPHRLFKDLSELSRLGAPPLLRTLEEQQEHLSYGSPERIHGIRAVIPHLDTRPSHQAEFIGWALGF